MRLTVIFGMWLALVFAVFGGGNVEAQFWMASGATFAAAANAAITRIWP